LASWAIGGIIYTVVGIILLLPLKETETLVDVLNSLFNIFRDIFFPCIILYIAMRRVGYKRNTTYEGKPVKELLIPLIISILIFRIVDLAMDFYLSGGIAVRLINITVDINNLTSEELRENYYLYFILSAVLQSILFGVFMILGFYKGYIKREKDRHEITANENN